MGEQNITPPQCWSRLLCLAQSANGGSSGGPNQLMSKQDQKFVENAMVEAVHSTNPVKHMLKNIEQLKLVPKTKSEIGNITEIVDNLEELVCDIDCAADFCKLGGLVEVIRLLKSDCDSVRYEVARLIQSLTQNNPNVQDFVLETDLLPSLLNILEETNASEELLVKALSSLSSIVRGHKKAFSQFNQQKGLETIENVFRKAIDMHYSKLSNKVVLIITSIAVSLGSDVKQYNILPILFRMALQLTPDSVGCSYFLDYLLNNIVYKEEDNNGLKSDELKVNFMELDNHSKQHFYEFLKRQLDYEEHFSHEGYLERIEKMNVMLNEHVKIFK
ncbi:unnamed protein product [Litomosoides sigmodontis]|uniref:Nucleotide exchange factor Fes1 domain-containing protein n=1 Tax=Litomosoides sigmodontis TaxID=42156 RepID=A0A3P6U4N4_LITSI|nr:unnamed protein product [Litomosoides sigmodontis]